MGFTARKVGLPLRQLKPQTYCVKSREYSLSTHPTRMKAVGHSNGHDDGGDGACSDVSCIDNLALALVFSLVMDKTHQVTVVL